MKKFGLLLLGLFSFNAVFASVWSTTLVEQRSDIREFIQYMDQNYHYDTAQLTAYFNTIPTVSTSKVAYNKRPVIHQMQNQQEFIPWYQYRDQFITSTRIAEGNEYWHKNQVWLRKASQIYGIPPQIIVATIGVETRYGQKMGQFPVFQTLAVLAFDYSPRKAYFLKELVAFLLYCRHNHLDTLSINGSYAGAIGEPQFMPSNLSRYAVDFDHQGKIDLIHDEPDAIGSIAHFFNTMNWQPNKPVALRAKVTGSAINQLLAKNHSPKMTVENFTKYGIVPVGQVALTDVATLITLRGKDGPEYWLAFNNFRVLKNYNNSTDYAMALYQLSVEIANRHQQY